jgi:hypothetical protein
MATPKINFPRLRQSYKKADAKERAFLIEALGIDIFNGNIMERVTTLREACEETGRDFDKEFSIEHTSCESLNETGFRELGIIFEALNEGEEIDFFNASQKKYYGWIEYVSGRGLSLGVVYCVNAHTYVGPRLCTVNEKLYRYAFTQFPDSFNKFFLNHKK